MNKKGDLTGIFYLIISIAAFAIFLLIIGYITPQIMVPLKNQIGINENINNSLTTSINIAAKTLPTIWFLVFTGLFLGLFITAYLMQTEPIFIPIFIIGVIIAVIVAVPLSNSYTALAADSTLASTAVQQSSIGYILTNLPLVTFIIGLIVLIVTFAKPGGGRESLA